MRSDNLYTSYAILKPSEISCLKFIADFVYFIMLVSDVGSDETVARSSILSLIYSNWSKYFVKNKFPLQRIDFLPQR